MVHHGPKGSIRFQKGRDFVFIYQCLLSVKLQYISLRNYHSIQYMAECDIKQVRLELVDYCSGYSVVFEWMGLPSTCTIQSWHGLQGTAS